MLHALLGGCRLLIRHPYEFVRFRHAIGAPLDGAFGVMSAVARIDRLAELMLVRRVDDGHGAGCRLCSRTDIDLFLPCLVCLYVAVFIRRNDR